MEDLIGVYGILDRAHWPEAPFQLPMVLLLNTRKNGRTVPSEI